jgi:hypothetical protein
MIPQCLDGPKRTSPRRRVAQQLAISKRIILPKSFPSSGALPNNAGETLKWNERATRVGPVAKFRES